MLEKLLSGIIFNIFNVIVQVFVGLLVFRELLAYMGEDDFGVWAVIIALVSQIKLLQFGLGAIVSRETSRLSDNKGNLHAKVVVSTAFVILASIGFVFSVTFILNAYFWLDNDFKIFLHDRCSVFFIVVFLVFSQVFGFFGGGFSGYLSGKFCFNILNAIKISFSFFRLLLVFIVICFDAGVVYIAAVFAFVALLEVTMMLFFSWRVGLHHDFNISLVTWNSVKQVMSSGGLFFPMRVNDYIRNNSAVLMTGYLSGPASAVPIRLSGRLMEIYVELAVTLNFVLTPYFSNLKENVSSDFNKNFRISLFFSSVLSSFIFFNIFILGEWFLKFWLGDVPKDTWGVLQILLFGYVIANIQSPVSSMMIAKGRYKYLSMLSVMETLLTLSLMPLFIVSDGAVGAAKAVVVSLVLVLGVVQPLVVSRIIKMSLVKYFYPIVIGCLASGFFVFSSFLIVGFFVFDDTLMPFVFIFVEVFFVFFVVFMVYLKRFYKK